MGIRINFHLVRGRIDARAAPVGRLSCKEEAMKGSRRRTLAAAVIVLVVGGAAAIFLGNYFGPVKSNIRRLGNPDPQVQKQAVDALVQMGQTAVPALAEALKDKKAYVRTN